jgi:hypothetical protein
LVKAYVTDTVLQRFWYDEFDKLTDTQRMEAVSPITNKIGQCISSPVLRNIFAQQKSKLSIKTCMDTNKILLINLSKGKV